MEPDPREWSERAHTFYSNPEILADKYQCLSKAFGYWLKAATAATQVIHVQYQVHSGDCDGKSGWFH